MISRYITKTNVDYLYILIASMLVALAGLFVIKSMQVKFKEEDFNNYVLMLRYAGTITPLLIMGMGVAIPRYIGFITKNDDRNKKTYSIIKTSFIIVIITIIFYLSVSWCFFDYIDRTMFGSNNGYYYYASIYFITMALYGFSNSILRGKELFRVTSFFEVTVRVIIPLGCLFVFANIENYILGVSFFSIIIALSIIISNININRFEMDRAIFRFGVGRVLGDIQYPLMITIPVLYMVYINETSDAAKLSIGYMVVNVFLIPVRPISTLILPKVGRIFVFKKNTRLQIKHLLLYSNIMAFVLVVIYMVIARFVWGFFDYTLDYNYYVFGGILYCSVVYIICRSVLDGIYEKAYLFRYLTIALTIEILGILVIHVLNIGYGYSTPLLISNAILISLMMNKLRGIM